MQTGQNELRMIDLPFCVMNASIGWHNLLSTIWLLGDDIVDNRTTPKITCALLFPPGSTIGSATTNTASVISTAPVITTAASSPSLSPSPTAPQTTSAEQLSPQEIVTAVSQAPSSLASTFGTGQVMVASSLSAALQGAGQLPTSASLAAMAAAAGLNPGLMASSQFAPGWVCLYVGLLCSGLMMHSFVKCYVYYGVSCAVGLF